MNSKLKVLLAVSAVLAAFFAGPSIDKLISNTPQVGQNIEQVKDQIVVPIENVGPLAPLYAGSTIEQSFVTNLKTLNSVSLYVATYFKSNLPGKGTFQLLDSSRGVLVNEEFQLSKLKDNTYLTFNFDPVSINPENQYFLTLASDVQSPASTFTLWSNRVFQRADFFLKENGIALKGAVIFSLAGR